MALTAGVLVGPYRILDLLGRGGMGEVYRARDDRLRRDVAIKVLPESVAADVTRLRRFEQEALAAGSLNHANVVTVHDVGSHGGLHYLVAECLEGETLRHRIEARTLTTRRAIEFAIQIARGLGAAHARGIIHRDVKPENLFVCTGETVKILDFGLAKLREPDPTLGMETAPLLTAVNTVVGTAAYMSPEQVRGLTVDVRSDIFSLGIVVYEMLAGVRPFKGATVVEVQTAILREDPPPLVSVRPDIPPPLDQIVLRCLEKQPHDRLDTARDLAFALETLLVAGPNPVPVPFAPARSRLRTAAVAATALIAGALAAPPLVNWLHPWTPPHYTQLTFKRGTITGARFAHQSDTIVYSAAWEGAPSRLFTTGSGGSDSRALGIDGVLWSISATDDLAIRSQGSGTRRDASTLALVPLSGGAPRPRLEDVEGADWSREASELAVVRKVDAEWILEHPIGRPIYRSPFELVNPCVLPDGQVAIFEQIGDREERPLAVSLVGSNSARRILSEGWTGSGQIAWSDATRELYFSGWTGVGDATLHAVTLSRKKRLVARIPGDFNLNAIDRRGGMLMTRHVARGSVFGRRQSDAEEQDLSWRDFSGAVDLSEDGRLLLLSEFGGDVAARGGIGIREPHGDVRKLGEGSPLALSPGGGRVLALPSNWQDAGNRLIVMPVGAGEQRALQHPALPRVFDATWIDERRFIVAAGADDRRLRLYLWDADNSAPPQPVSDEGQFGRPVVAPNAQAIAVRKKEGPLTLYALDGSSRPMPGGLPDHEPLRWSKDGAWLLVRRGSGIVAVIERLELATGKRLPL